MKTLEKNKDRYTLGRRMLQTPVRPLLSILEFIYITGGFSSIKEVMDQLPDSIETATAVYDNPAKQMQHFLPELTLFQQARTERPSVLIVDTNDQILDAQSTASFLLAQSVLEKELESINSLLCGVHQCTLCCTGPSKDMQNEFFEIPLGQEELIHFQLPLLDTLQTAKQLANEEPRPLFQGHFFYAHPSPLLADWQNGWSMILPRQTACPHLGKGKRCEIYVQRPQVCRRPQIFPYVLEPLPSRESKPCFRIRNSLLAVMDCPYVQDLQEDIGLYAAASELELFFSNNKK